jgi:hypothetical protein
MLLGNTGENFLVLGRPERLQTRPAGECCPPAVRNSAGKSMNEFAGRVPPADY